MPSPGASEGFGQALNGASASSYACDTSAASSVATPRLCVWGPRLGSTASSPSVESVTLGLRLLPSPGASAVSKASCEARVAAARPRHAAARRGARTESAEAPRPKSVDVDAACAACIGVREVWCAFYRLRRGKRRVGNVEGLPGDGEQCVARRTSRLVRRRARWCAGERKEDGRLASL